MLGTDEARVDRLYILDNNLREQPFLLIHVDPSVW
jgi:hypothetical protein